MTLNLNLFSFTWKQINNTLKPNSFNLESFLLCLIARNFFGNSSNALQSFAYIHPPTDLHTHISFLCISSRKFTRPACLSQTMRWWWRQFHFFFRNILWDILRLHGSFTFFIFVTFLECLLLAFALTQFSYAAAWFFLCAALVAVPFFLFLLHSALQIIIWRVLVAIFSFSDSVFCLLISTYKSTIVELSIT